MLQDRLSRILVIIFVIGLTTSIALSEAALILLILTWILRMFQERRVLWNETPLDKAFGLLIIAGGLSVIFSQRPDRSFHEYHNIFLYFAFFAVVAYLRTERDLVRIIRILFYIFTAVGIYVAAKYWLDVETRVQSTTGGTQTLAGFCLLLIPFFTAIISGIYKERLDKCLFLPKAGRRSNLLIGVSGLLIMVLGLSYTFTRMAYVGTLAGLMVVVILLKKKRIVLLILIPLVLIVTTTDYVERWRIFSYGPVTGQTDEYLADRFYMWDQASKMITDHAVTGIGYGLMDSRVNLYTGKLDLEEKTRDTRTTEEYRVAHLHNNWIQLWVEQGVLGLLAFLFFNLQVLMTLRRGILTTEDSFQSAIGVGVFASAIAFFLAGLVEYNWGDSEVLMVFLTLIAVGIRSLLAGHMGTDFRCESSCSET